MKQTRWFAFVLAGGMLLASCGGNKEEAKTEETNTEQSSTTAENNVSTANVETGTAATTHTAIAATTLKGFMPNLSGWKMDGETETVQTKMSGMEYSVATQNYTNGDKEIKLVLADYNGVASLTAAYSMLMGMSVETNKEVTKGEKFGNHQGWVNYQKDNSQSQIGVAVNDRVWLIAEGRNGTSIDELRSAVNAMDLNRIGSEH